MRSARKKEEGWRFWVLFAYGHLQNWSVSGQMIMNCLFFLTYCKWFSDRNSSWGCDDVSCDVICEPLQRGVSTKSSPMSIFFVSESWEEFEKQHLADGQKSSDAIKD